MRNSFYRLYLRKRSGKNSKSPEAIRFGENLISVSDQSSVEIQRTGTEAPSVVGIEER